METLLIFLAVSAAMLAFFAAPRAFVTVWFIASILSLPIVVILLLVGAR